MIGSIFKAVRGSIGPDEMGELLAAMGIKVEIAPVEGQAAMGAAFQCAARGALVEGAKLHKMRGITKTGETLEALFILIPSPAVTDVPLTLAEASV